jgi:GNAT acetyltransferase-like protein
VNPVLVTDRLALRPFCLGDADELHEIFSDPATHTIGDGPLTSVAQTMDWIRRRISAQHKHGLLWYAVRDRETGHLMGNCGLFTGRTGTAEPEIGYEMGAAPLPGGAGQGRADRVGQAAVGVGGDELDAGQAAGGQVTEEAQPPGAVLGGGDLRPRISRCPSLLTPVASRAWTLTTRPPSRTFSTSASAARNVYGPASSGRVRKSSTTASRSAAITDTCDLLSRVMPRVSTSFSIRRRRHSQQVAGRHHAGQRCLGAAAPFQQPVGEVTPGAEPGDRHIQRPGPGVEVPVPVAVADIHPVR